MGFGSLLNKLSNSLKRFSTRKKVYERLEEGSFKTSDARYKELHGKNRIEILAMTYDSFDAASEDAEKMYTHTQKTVNGEQGFEQPTSEEKEVRSMLLGELTAGREWKLKRNANNYFNALEKTMKEYMAGRFDNYAEFVYTVMDYVNKLENSELKEIYKQILGSKYDSILKAARDYVGEEVLRIPAEGVA